ncbi:MAG: hypothetical protein H6767_00920 [Candidatus Peribacteria bacterium]|nr:MAG: hypothetical protein H6767_00920 [Candidatus Peribacteria bacterium]
MGNFASLDTIIMVKPDFQIREDIMLAEGIERNDVEELNTIADGIDSMI